MPETLIDGLCGKCLYEKNPELFRKPERETSKPGDKYEAAQAELKRILKEQQTVSVPKLRRLINSLNVSLQPGKTPDSAEVAYLKKQLGDRNHKLSIMGQKLKKLEASKK